MGLDIILKDASERGIDEFIFCGDYVSDGPEPEEVIQRIKSLNGHCVRGNREDYMLSYHAGHAAEWDTSLQCAPLLWTYKKLSKSSIEFIKALPDKKSIEILQYEIMISHGTPYSTTDVIKPFKNDEKFRKITSDFNENVFILGHTHHVWGLKFKDRYFVNAGCSGLPIPGSYPTSYFTYVIMNISKDGLNFEKVNIPCDFKVFEDYFKTNNYLQENGMWARLLLPTIKTGHNYCVGFLEYCHEIARKDGLAGYKLIPNEIWEKAAASWPYEAFF
jgi:predicted phosphodiesterase